MEQTSRNLLAQIPRMLFVMDLVGSICIGLGVWVLIADDELPVFAGYNRLDVGAAFILVGILLMVPFVVVLIRIVLGTRTSSRPNS